MFNRWEMEDDNDSDFGAESPRDGQKSATRVISAARRENISSHVVDNNGKFRANRSNNSVGRSSENRHFQSSSSGFYSDDDEDDLEVEELPHGVQAGKAIAKVPGAGRKQQNSDYHGEFSNSKGQFQNQTKSSPRGVTSERDQFDEEKVTAEELKDAYDVTAARAASGGGYGSDAGVDKIELARVLRQKLDAQSLADDVLNLSKRSVSWSALLTVAKPYLKGPVKPSKDAYLLRKNEGQGGLNSPERNRTDKSASDVWKGKTVGFSSTYDDDSMGREGTPDRVTNATHSRPPADSSSSGPSKWPQSRGDLKVTKSMEQESWHDQGNQEFPRREENRFDSAPSPKISDSVENVSDKWSNRSGESNRSNMIPQLPVDNNRSDRSDRNDRNDRSDRSDRGHSQQSPRTPPRQSSTSQSLSQTTLGQSYDESEGTPRNLDDDESDTSSLAAYRRNTALQSSSNTPLPSSPSRNNRSESIPPPSQLTVVTSSSPLTTSRTGMSLSPSGPIGDSPLLHNIGDNHNKRTDNRADNRTDSRTDSNQGNINASTDSALFSPKVMRPLASSWETALSQRDDEDERGGEGGERGGDRGGRRGSPGKVKRGSPTRGSPNPPPRPPRQASPRLASSSSDRAEDTKDYIGNKEATSNRNNSARGNRPVSMPLPRNQGPLSDMEGPNREGNNRPTSLSHSERERDTNVKRSISWSAAVESSKKPPRPKSMSAMPPSSLYSSFDNRDNRDGRDGRDNRDNRDQSSSYRDSRDSRDQRNNESVSSSFKGRESSVATSHDFDGHVALPPLSEYAMKTGVIIEGWLEKKSSVTGLWQKRYFALSESSTDFCVLRIYYQVVESSWGCVPLKMKASIPIAAMQGVKSVSAKIKTGKQFTLSFLCPHKKPPTPTPTPRPEATRRNSLSQLATSRDSGYGSSINDWGDSDAGVGDGKTKAMTLKAENLKTRMLWMAMLGKVLQLYNEEYDQ